MLIGSEQPAGGKGETGELMANSSRDRLMFFGSVTSALNMAYASSSIHKKGICVCWEIRPFCVRIYVDNL